MKSQSLEHMRQDEAEVYWVSYMESEQRVLLFTQHKSIFMKAKSIIDPETSKKEIFLSIAAIGISVVSKCSKLRFFSILYARYKVSLFFLQIVQDSSLHNARRELLYASIMDSAAHWELYFGKRWRNLSLDLSAWLENKYTNASKGAQLENFIDVRF